MERTFSNQANGHTETIGSESWLAVLFFGAFYLAYKGLWVHFFIWMVLVAGFSVITGGPGLIIALPLASIGYAIGIKDILANSYLRKGWVETSAGSTGALAGDTRSCPLCAETIKNAAVKCKHCGADVEAVIAPAPLSGWVASIPCVAEEQQDRARISVASLGMPVAPMIGSSVGAGPFATKDEAKLAREALRDQQNTYSEVIYWSPGDDMAATPWALAIPCRKQSDREMAIATAELLDLPSLPAAAPFIRFGPFLSKDEAGEALRRLTEKGVHGNIEEIRKP